MSNQHHLLKRPGVIAEVTSTVFFASTNRKVAEHVDPDIPADPGIHPDADTRSRQFPDRGLDARARRPGAVRHRRPGAP